MLALAEVSPNVQGSPSADLQWHLTANAGSKAFRIAQRPVTSDRWVRPRLSKGIGTLERLGEPRSTKANLDLLPILGSQLRSEGVFPRFYQDRHVVLAQPNGR